MAAITAFMLLSVGAPASASTDDPDQARVVASLTGTPDGDGTIARPLDLATALGPDSPARPGDTVLIRGGTYAGAFESTLTGTPDEPITVRSFPGEWATFDGGELRKPALTIRGSDTRFREFEVTKSDPNRISEQVGSEPTDQSRGTSGIPGVRDPQPTFGEGINVFGPRTKVINTVVHDAGNGIGFWRGATGAELHGNVIYNNGWSDASHDGWGHAVYSHNGSSTKTISNNIMFNNFGNGVTAWDGYFLQAGYLIDRNVAFENGAPNGEARANLYAGSSRATSDRFTVTNNVTYHRASTGTGIRLGPATTPGLENGTVTVRDNTIVGGNYGLILINWREAAVTGNEIQTMPSAPSTTQLVQMFTPQPDDPIEPLAGYTFDDNAYVDKNFVDGANPKSFMLHDALLDWTPNRLGLPGWRALTGLDGSSTYSSEPSDGTRVVVEPNAYETGRAHVTIHNPAGDPEVPVDLAPSGLEVGQPFEVRDVQDLSGPPVYHGVYRGTPVTLPTTLTEVVQPIGGGRVPVEHTPIDFNVFLVIPVRPDGTTSLPVTPSTTTTNVALDADAPVYGDPLSATAQVSGSGELTGTIRFAVDGEPVGEQVLDTDGVATLALPAIDAGDHVVTATYSGDALRSSSSGEAALTVDRAPSSISLPAPARAEYGEALSATAYIASEPIVGGTVQWSVDGVAVGDPIPVAEDASAPGAFGEVPAGQHEVRAAYSGDANHDASEAATTMTVERAASTTRVTLADGSVFGDAVTATANVTGASGLDGTVQWSVDGVAVGGPIPLAADGSALRSLESLPPGPHEVRAVYSGDENHIGSEAGTSLTVRKVRTTLIPDGGRQGSRFFQATLREVDHDAVVAGATVRFIVKGKTVCTVTTDASGRARCRKTAKDKQAKAFSVRFEGSDTHLASAATEKVKRSR